LRFVRLRMAMAHHPVNSEFDVVVIGAGHAGCEAALAAARLGCHTCLLTISIDAVAQMSCNPAIGGLAKGQLVREIDALGGEMAKVTDMTALQFRMLNTGRGPAVRAPRAQCDREAYRREMRRRLLEQGGLLLRQDTALEILSEGGRVTGVLGRSGLRYRARAVVVTTGTFLRGLIHMGQNTFPGGRLGEPPAEHLSGSLQRLGLELGRLKTGTPPRVNGRTVNFEVLEPQPGDEPPRPFSFASGPEFLRGTRRQLPCWLTATNAETHRIIRANLHRAPLFTGQIKSVGPRYCPSIEDKVHRFPERDHHLVFLEPEGWDTHEMYCNGIATSVPIDVQEQFVRTIKGLENVQITRYGYAIEYDFVPPTQLLPSLECKVAEGLFLAGQINGTSGYEEAAAQGIIAGINAAMKVHGKSPLILRRDQAYIGVLIDDLVTKGTQEPYRMFTSRAEYRLLLRHDNADRRLMPIGYRLGLIPETQMRRLQAKEAAIAATLAFLRGQKHSGDTLELLLRRPGMTFRDIRSIAPEIMTIIEPHMRAFPAGADEAFLDEVAEQVEIEVKYAGYAARQMKQIEQFRRMEDRPIPPDLDYARIRELRVEARQKLARIRPISLGQAARISGVSPADIAILMVHLQRQSGA